MASPSEDPYVVGREAGRAPGFEAGRVVPRLAASVRLEAAGALAARRGEAAPAGVQRGVRGTVRVSELGGESRQRRG